MHEMQSFRLQLAASARSRGFSRIELLVLIAILAALTLLLVPGILHAREAARHRQSNNNLRNLACAFAIQKFDKIKNDSLANFAGMYPGTASDDQTDSKLVLGTIAAILAAIAAMLGSLFIRFAVRFFNRRSDRFANGIYEELESGSSFGGWFCPPSSSSI
jgi:competence protein ComGC